MSKFLGIAFLPALIFLAGCVSKQPAEPAPAENAAAALPATLGTLSYVAPAASTPSTISRPVAAQKQYPLKKIRPAHSNALAVQPPSPDATSLSQSPSTATWISLNNWAAEHKIAPPRLIHQSPSTLYAVVAGKNMMTFTIGSRGATWNGIKISLGFEPEMIDGEICLHHLDLEKNLEPLLCEPPLSFSPASRVIVLDPGHGGHNHGTISLLDGRPEKEFTLDLAKQLKPLLEAEGWTVFLTRTNDTDMTLSNRVAFAAAHRADCFISLHFNSVAPNEEPRGLMTFCLTPAGMPSTETRGYSDVWSENLPGNHFDSQNLRLAVRVHRAILRALDEQDRGVQRMRFSGVLRGQNCPAILIEGGFLSNLAEAAEIENPRYRQKLAAAIAAALK